MADGTIYLSFGRLPMKNVGFSAFIVELGYLRLYKYNIAKEKRYAAAGLMTVAKLTGIVPVCEWKLKNLSKE